MGQTTFFTTRRYLTLVLPWLCVKNNASAQNQAESKTPPLAPSWALPLWNAQGSRSRELTSKQLLGQWVYLDFWASWCGPCKLSFPWMSQLQHQLRDSKLQVVAVGLDKQAAPMEHFLKLFPGHVQVVWDPSAETAKRFDVQAMPSSYLINPAGQLVWRHRGFQSSDSVSLLQEISRRIELS